MAVYPVSPGGPDYSSDASTKYIPSIYSKLLVRKFYPKSSYAQISNTEYEGEIKTMGDTVDIRTRPTIETFRYKKGMVLPIQNPESPFETLKIDQGEGFSFALDDVDEFQSDLDLMNEWGDDAAEQLVQVMDRNVLINLSAAGAVAEGNAATTIDGYDPTATPDLSNFSIANGALVNGGTTSRKTLIALGQSDSATLMNTGDLITGRILYYNRLLDENNAPQERFVCFPTWVRQILLSMTNNAFGLAYATGQNNAGLLTGDIPNLDRMSIMFSNNQPDSTEAGVDRSSVLFGCKYATTFATQIEKSRTMENPFTFGKMFQGLQIYGYSIIKPPLLGVDFIKSIA